MTAEADRRRAKGPAAPAGDDAPTLPERTSEEESHGWGEDSDDRAERDAWYQRERPPHHG